MGITKMTVKSKKEAGQALVLSCLLLLILLGVAAFSIDYGCAVTWRTELRRAVDAAALAGGAEIEGDDPVATAISFAGKNRVAGDNLSLSANDVVLGTYDFDYHTFSAVEDPALANAIRVVGDRSSSSLDGPIPTLLASVMGVDTVELSAEATAAMNPLVSGVAGGSGVPLVPFLIHADSVGGINGGVFSPALEQNVAFYPTVDDIPGNFGLANLDGGSNDTPELVEWITNGFPDPIEISGDTGVLTVEGTPGFVSAIKTAVEDRIGETVIVLVFDEVSGVGSNSVFQVRTFCALQITGCKLTGAPATQNITGKVVPLVTSGVIARSSGLTNTALRKLELVR